MTVADPSSVRACLAVLHGVPAFTLTGEDVRRWSNGMFTNNTRRLRPGQGNRHCACDDRGRLQGVLDLYLIADDKVALVLEGMTREAFMARYGMYLVLDDIEVGDEDSVPAVLTLQGPDTASVLEAAGLPFPDGSHAHSEVGGDPFTDEMGLRVCRKDRTGLDGVDILCGQARVAGLVTELESAGAQAVSPDVLDALRVLHGRAAWPADGNPKTMVHELRLNEECCAFDKGCYVGQEVLNRIDVRGGINKRLTGLQLSAPVEIGAAVRLNGRTVGKISSRATLGSGVEVALGLLRKTAWEAGTAVSVLDGDLEVSGCVVELPLTA
jgi:folate-binding protein YgfZ